MSATKITSFSELEKKRGRSEEKKGEKFPGRGRSTSEKRRGRPSSSKKK